MQLHQINEQNRLLNSSKKNTSPKSFYLFDGRSESKAQESLLQKMQSSQTLQRTSIDHPLAPQQQTQEIEQKPRPGDEEKWEQRFAEAESRILTIKQGFINEHRGTTFTQLQKAVKEKKSSALILFLCKEWIQNHPKEKQSEEEKNKQAAIDKLARLHQVKSQNELIEFSSDENLKSQSHSSLKSIYNHKEVLNALYKGTLKKGKITNVERNEMLHHLYIIRRSAKVWMQEKESDKTSAQYLDIKKVNADADGLILKFSKKDVEQIKPHEFDALITTTILSRVQGLTDKNVLSHYGDKTDLHLGKSEGKTEFDDNSLDNLKTVDKNGNEVWDRNAAAKVAVTSSIRKVYNNLKDFNPSDQVNYQREQVSGAAADLGAAADGVGAVDEMVYRNSPNKDFSLSPHSNSPSAVGNSASQGAGAINQTAFTENHSTIKEYIDEIKGSAKDIKNQLSGLLDPKSPADAIEHFMRLMGELNTIVSPVKDILGFGENFVDVLMGGFVWQRANHVIEYLKGREQAISEEDSLMIELQEEIRWDEIRKAIQGGIEIVAKILTFSGFGAVAGIPMIAASKATKTAGRLKTRVYDRDKYDQTYKTIVDKVLLDVKSLPKLENKALSKWKNAEVELYGIGVTAMSLPAITALKLRNFSHYQKLFHSRTPGNLLRDYLVDMQKARVFKSITKVEK